MIWSPQQAQALTEVERWRKNPDHPWFFLDGYAGTGKTRLAKHLAEGCNAIFACPTGKAAYVMRNAGCTGAQTIHSLIYQPADKSRKHLRELQTYLGDLLKAEPVNTIEVEKVRVNIKQEEKNLSRPSFSLNLESDLRGADLLVVDEGSMVDRSMGEDLISFDVPILVLGDTAQLPPVYGAGYFTARDPDWRLTEVHRQALDSPVLRLATIVREGGTLVKGRYEDSRVIGPGELSPQEVLQANQILVGRNMTRHASNRRIRELRDLKDFYPFPAAGERLVCLRNNHDLGLLNGQTYVTQEAANDHGYIGLKLRPSEGDTDRTIYVEAHREHFLGREVNTWERREAEEFDFGYAMTVHKFQGSQERGIVLFDEWHGDHRRQWLYTGLTRAQDWIYVVQM